MGTPIQFIVVLLCSVYTMSDGCDELFEGFGVHLGAMGHFSQSLPSMVQQVFDKTYNDLEIR